MKTKLNAEEKAHRQGWRDARYKCAILEREAEAEAVKRQRSIPHTTKRHRSKALLTLGMAASLLALGSEGEL
jgi:hypothetical protein